MAIRFNPFRPLTVREIAERELEENERKLMEVERHISYYVALEEHLRREINRLGEYIDEGSTRDNKPFPKPISVATKHSDGAKVFVGDIGAQLQI